jgi:hypothetical protein
LFSEGLVYTTEEVLVELLTFFAGDVWLRIPPSKLCARFLPTVPYASSLKATLFSLALICMLRGQTVLTNDRHFEQEGFEALFR